MVPAFNGSVLYGLNVVTPPAAPHVVTIDTATGAVTDIAATVIARCDRISPRDDSVGAR